MKKLSKSAWIMGLVLASSTALSCSEAETEDVPKDALEIEEGTRLVVGDYGNLTAAEREHYRQDLAYLRDLAPPDQAVRLNLADPQLHRLVMARVKLSGKTPANAPNLFATIERTREDHVRLGYGRGLLPTTSFRDAGEGRTEEHFIGGASVNGEVGEAVASSTFPEGSFYTYVDVGYYDADGLPVALPNVVEEFGDGTNANVQTDADLTQSERDAYLVDTYKMEDNGLDFTFSYVYTETGLASTQPLMRPTPPTLEIQNVTAPTDVANNDGIVSICLNRVWTGDCDYDLTGNTQSVKVPLQGSIQITSGAHVFSADAIDTIKADLAAGIGNPRAGYIKLLLTQAGGGCDVASDGALVSSMQVFWDNTTLSPDQKTLTWNMTGANSAFFDDGCRQVQDIVYLTMRLQLPVVDTINDLHYWISKTLTNNPTQFNPSFVYDDIKVTNSCLAAGTLLQMADGSLVPVEQIASGDHVFNSLHDGAKGLTVTDTAIGFETEPMVRLEDELGHSVLMTSMHPVKTPDRGIVLAKDLREGDLVLTVDGTSALRRVEREAFGGKVYNVKLGTTMEKAALGLEDSTLVYANGFLVGDGQVQSKYESIALAAPTQGDVLDRLPARWHRDYQLSPIRNK